MSQILIDAKWEKEFEYWLTNSQYINKQMVIRIIDYVEKKVIPNASKDKGGMQWQLCPKCDGQGSVSKPPYVPVDVDHWASSAVSFVCDVCNGAKIIAPPGGMQWVSCKNGLPDDWEFMHMRYAADHYKLDTHLFEERDGGLCKIGGIGRLEFKEIEYLIETPHTKDAEGEGKK